MFYLLFNQNTNPAAQISGPVFHYPYVRNQVPSNSKVNDGSNDMGIGAHKSLGKNTNHHRSLDVQMSALAINQPIVIGDNAANLCTKTMDTAVGGNGGGWIVSMNGDYGTSEASGKGYRPGLQMGAVATNVMGVQNAVLPMNPVSSAATVPLCHIHPSLAPQPNTGSPTPAAVLAPYPLAVQSDLNMMFQTPPPPATKQNMVVLGAPIGNAANMCPYPGVGLQQTIPVGNQSQVAGTSIPPSTGIINAGQPPPPLAHNPHFPYMNAISLPPNSSQMGARMPFPFGPQIPVGVFSLGIYKIKFSYCLIMFLR